MVSSLIVSESQIERRVRSRLHEMAQDRALALRRVSLHTKAGRPYEQICRLARRLEIDLIITATRGRTGSKHLALGSTAERVVRHASCPVLVCAPVGRVAPSFVTDLQEGRSADRFLSLCRARPGLCQITRDAIRVPARLAPFGSPFLLLHQSRGTFFTIFHHCSRRRKNRHGNKCSS